MGRDVRIDGIRRLFRLPSSRGRVRRDIDDEIRFHIESRTAELIARGVRPDTARAQAAREFGDVAEARSELEVVDRRRLTRERRAAVWETLRQDLGYSIRSLRRQPSFAGVVIVVLALGIGANATMFGVIDRLLLRPPPHVADPARLMTVGIVMTTSDGGEFEQRVLSYPIYRDLHAADRAFEHVAVWTPTDMATGRGADARDLRAQKVSAGFFSALGVRPMVGRFFLPEEDGNPTAPNVAVLGYEHWRNQRAADRAIVGKTIALGDGQYVVVGVAPEGFAGLGGNPVDVWVPLTASVTAEEHARWLQSRQAYWLNVVARLRPGVTKEQGMAIATAAHRAGAERDGVSAQRLASQQPRARLVSVLPREARAESAAAKVSILLGAVSILVLLIACANVANLQLARALARRREVAVRLALGIARGRLVRQLVSETVLLALAAGVAALLVTIWGGGIVRRVIFNASATAQAPLDLRLIAYTAGAAVVAGLLSGVLPALQASRPDLADSLRSGGRSGGPARSGTRGALLVVQAALTIVFLVGAGLFVRSLRRIEALPLGIEPARTLMVTAKTTGAGLGARDVDALYRRLEAAAAGVPGVASAALATSAPFSSAWAESVSLPGRDSVPKTGAGGPYFMAVGHDFFATVGTRVLRGRGLTQADRGAASRVAVVNQTLANLWWPGEDPIGQCMRVGGDTMPCTTVVGVAEDARRFALVEEPAVQFFVPIEHAPEWVETRVLFVRPSGNVQAMIEPLRRQLQSAVPDTPFLVIRALDDLVSPQRRSWRLGATMFGAFGLLAVIVAALGLYSVLAYDVSRRVHELGIRIALGARTADIGAMVLGRALRVAVVGAVIGFAVALSSARWVAPLLFDTSPRDVAAYATALAVLIGSAIVAALVPTRRAARVDPIVALRAE